MLLITRLNNGGAARHAVALGRRLEDGKHIAFLVTGRTEGNENHILDYARSCKVDPFVISQLRRSLNPFRDAISWIRVYRLILKKKPDIIHTHMSKAGFIGRSCALAYNLLHRKKTKIVHTFHGHVFHSYFSRFKTGIFIFFERILARYSDALLAVSPRIREDVDEKLRIQDTKKLRVIPLGIDFSPLERKKDENARIVDMNIGMLGRLAPIKNYDLALEIGKILKEQGIQARIQVGGSGDERIFQELSRSCPDNINFLGNVQNPQAFWQDMDMALLTSKNEGNPVALIEAMFTRLPFVATYVGGIPDMAVKPVRQKNNLWIFENCILIKGFNPNDFVEAIEFYHDSNIREKAGNAGYAFATKKYLFERLISDYEKLYLELTEKCH